MIPPGAGRESASVFGQYKRRQSLQPQLSDKLNTKQTLTHHNSIPASAFTCGFSWTPSHAQRTSILSHRKSKRMYNRGEPIINVNILSELICIIPQSGDIFTFWYAQQKTYFWVSLHSVWQEELVGEGGGLWLKPNTCCVSVAPSE